MMGKILWLALWLGFVAFACRAEEQKPGVLDLAAAQGDF